ncbi:MAG TPA: hypothetical protein DHV51_01545, partial [Opitutae bacterium]|nr:hypothetical protein [Opitutae bacterium]
FDGAAIVTLQYNDAADLLLVHSCVGTVKPDVTSAVLMELLSANCYWQGTQGATLGIEKEGGLVILAYSIPMPMAQPNQFQDIIATFVEVAREWTLKIRELKGEK